MGVPAGLTAYRIRNSSFTIVEGFGQ